MVTKLGTGSANRSYARVDLLERARHVRAARAFILAKVDHDLRTVRLAEERLSAHLGRPLTGCRILEIGPGQGRERSRYLARANKVACLDLDVYPDLGRPPTIVRAVRRNGLRRTAKAVARELVVERSNRAAWAEAVGEPLAVEPEAIVGDICQVVPQPVGWDAIVSWSVFEHLADPRRALANTIQALRPGGVLLHEVHLWTANNGHHDLRTCVGDETAVPPWAHLRPSVAHLVRPSSYLNRWRLAQWRDLFAELAPGHEEHLETPGLGEPWPPGAREELTDYTDEELLTISATYVWRKPT